jgi:cell division protease FtsH
MSNPVPPREAPDRPWRSEGTPEEEPPKPSPGGGRRMRGGWWSLALAALVVFLIAYLVLSFYNEGDEPTISYTEFSKQVDDGNVTKIYSKGDAIQGQLKKAQDNPGRTGSTPSSRPSARSSRTTSSGNSWTSTTSP